MFVVDSSVEHRHIDIRPQIVFPIYVKRCVGRGKCPINSRWNSGFKYFDPAIFFCFEFDFFFLNLDVAISSNIGDARITP